MRTFARTLVLAAIGSVSLACNRSDVGAPCQHAGGDTPSDPLISFPALACDQLMCVFGEDEETPSDPCADDADCVQQAGGVDTFECVSGRCAVKAEHVLERSMCSMKCDSDSDCEGGSEDTHCATGFACAPLMSLGDFCCQKVCVCRDDLATAQAQDLEDACAANDVSGCCDRDPRPEACG